MRISVLAGLLAVFMPATAQSPNDVKHLLVTGQKYGCVLSAQNIERGADYPSVIHARGAVKVQFGEILLTADEVDYDEATGDIEPRGHVRLKTHR
jgi:lipopolysaccharide assembly outer membrane protein LptD (OstA)